MTAITADYSQMSAPSAPAPKLNSLFEENPITEKTSCRRWSKAHAAAAIITAIAFTALAVVAIIFCSIYAVEQLPIVTILLVAAGLPMSWKLIQRFNQKSEKYAQEEIANTSISHLMKNLTSETTPNMLRNLKAHPGVASEKMKRILARYLYQQFEATKRIESVPDSIELSTEKGKQTYSLKDYTVKDITDKKALAIFGAIQERRVRREQLIAQAAFDKLKAAFLLKLLRNPYDSKKVDSFFQTILVSQGPRSFVAKYGDPHADAIIKKGEKVFTASEILNKPIEELTQTIFT